MAVSTILIIGVMILVGMTVYGYFAQITPHDFPYINETISGTYASGQAYYGAFTNKPINNDTTLVCYNGSTSTAANLMTNGGGNISLRFNIVENTYFNITHTGYSAARYNNIACSYYFDWAANEQQTFWNNATTTSFAGFVLSMVIVIVLAASAIIGYVVLLRG